MGEAYNRNRKYDSATLVNKKGIEITLKNKDSVKVAHFILSMGITDYLKKNYNSSLDHFQKVKETLEKVDDDETLITCYLYLGKTYKGEIKDAIPYFEKIDSIAKENLAASAEILEACAILYEYYIVKKKAKGRLTCLERQLSLTRDNIYLKENISKRYDILQLTLQKDNIIHSLNGVKKNSRIWIISLSSMVLLIGTFTYYYYRKQRIYWAKFKTLLNKNGLGKEQSSHKTTNTISELNFSEKALNNITEKLKTFIEKKQFLSNDLSLHSLAKSMETNPSYLSKVINFYEQKSFTTYITELRINYVIKELKTNTTFRKYSIRAIAGDIGFNNAQSFSRAFYKQTGIYPSYFIKELEKELLNCNLQRISPTNYGNMSF